MDGSVERIEITIDLEKIVQFGHEVAGDGAARSCELWTSLAKASGTDALRLRAAIWLPVAIRVFHGV